MVEKNKSFFENGEANEWFNRNKERLENRRNDTTIDLLADWLKPFADEITDILEIGCGGGIAPADNAQGVVDAHVADGLLEHRGGFGHCLFGTAVHGRFHLVHIAAEAELAQGIGNGLGRRGQLEIEGSGLGKLGAGPVGARDQGFLDACCQF